MVQFLFKACRWLSDLTICYIRLTSQFPFLWWQTVLARFMYFLQTRTGKTKLITKKKKLAKAGSEINFFRQAPIGDRNFFFQSPNGKMWSPKSFDKTFTLQGNTSQNYWSPRACLQNTCNRWNQESNQCWNQLLTTLTDLHCHLLTPREYLNLHLISSRMFRLHLVINYGKISEHLWTPHRLNKYSWRKNACGLLHLQYLCYGKPLKKNMAAKLCTILAVKHCGRFIIKGNRFNIYFQSNGKVKRKLPIGGWLWVLFWSILLKIEAIVCVIIVAWNSVVNRQLATSCGILVAGAKFLVALVTRKVHFRTLLILSKFLNVIMHVCYWGDAFCHYIVKIMLMVHFLTLIWQKFMIYNTIWRQKQEKLMAICKTA